MTKKLNVGLIGYGFMGRTHSNAYCKVNHFFDLPYEPVRKVICGLDEKEAKAFADQWGYESHTTDWKKVIAAADIDLVDICVPNNVHAEIAIAAAKAGKAIFCEKPLALDGPQVETMVEAALTHHIHHRDKNTALTGQLGKPEAYYFPPQANNHSSQFPYTSFGLNPSVNKDQVRKALLDAAEGRDNSITSLAPAYRLDVGTGWDVPPGVLHAPRSLCTYEPQKASDVFVMYENITHDQVVPKELLWKDTPKDKEGDVDWLFSVIDWDLNVDPDFVKNRFMAPKPVRPVAEMEAEGYIENWVCYKSDAFSAKELTVLPGKTVTIKDNASCGFITMQGYGKFGVRDIENPALIRQGQLTNDEFVVSEAVAKEDIVITNPSQNDPIVPLKHFVPQNPEIMRKKAFTLIGLPVVIGVIALLIAILMPALAKVRTTTNLAHRATSATPLLGMGEAFRSAGDVRTHGRLLRPVCVCLVQNKATSDFDVSAICQAESTLKDRRSAYDDDSTSILDGQQLVLGNTYIKNTLLTVVGFLIKLLELLNRCRRKNRISGRRERKYLVNFLWIMARIFKNCYRFLTSSNRKSRSIAMEIDGDVLELWSILEELQQL